MLFLLFFQPVSYLSIFKIQRYQIRYEIKQRIKAGITKDELVLIKIPGKSEHEIDFFSWLIPENELRYKNKMYDVVYEESQHDTSLYYCILDEEETELYANIDNEVSREMSQSPQQEQRRETLERALTLLFFYPKNDFSTIRLAENTRQSLYCFGLKTWITSPLTPPPKV